MFVFSSWWPCSTLCNPFWAVLCPCFTVCGPVSFRSFFYVFFLLLLYLASLQLISTLFLGSLRFLLDFCVFYCLFWAYMAFYGHSFELFLFYFFILTIYSSYYFFGRFRHFNHFLCSYYPSWSFFAYFSKFKLHLLSYWLFNIIDLINSLYSSHFWLSF